MKTSTLLLGAWLLAGSAMAGEFGSVDMSLLRKDAGGMAGVEGAAAAPAGAERPLADIVSVDEGFQRRQPEVAQAILAGFQKRLPRLSQCRGNMRIMIEPWNDRMNPEFSVLISGRRLFRVPFGYAEQLLKKVKFADAQDRYYRVDPRRWWSYFSLQTQDFVMAKTLEDIDAKTGVITEAFYLISERENEACRKWPDKCISSQP